MSSNLRRYDLSDRLIHFVREVDLGGRDPVPPPEDEYYGGGSVVDGPRLDPLFLLRLIVRQGRVLPTWSRRGGRRTIYGPSPAVCFTEMPLVAFLQAGAARSRAGQAMSSYGLVFKKSEVFREGGRPVIYGLSGEHGEKPVPGPGRLLDGDSLGLAEQFRYVAFDADRAGRLDWSHEREWRWPARGAGVDVEGYVELLNAALDLAGFSGVGLVVQSEEESERVLGDLVVNVDCGYYRRDTFDFVLVRDRLPTDLVSLVGADEQDRIIDDSRISVDGVLRAGEESWDQLVAAFDELVDAVWSTAPPFEKAKGAPGRCWLWVLDVGQPLVRALVNAGRVTINRDRKYLVEMPEWPDYLGLEIRQGLVLEIADRMNARFGVEGTYYSVLMYGNENTVPFYIGRAIWDQYTNIARQ